ncbi:Transcription factor aig1 [Thalictrum thalictroides]|uniref:Transcription factor aig1 n=1 Tax=Thalictrum thalictroides TaxID=46969 RepID=A0A7J6XD71_THATH|nr:Transcription factor aig1 [Thalictrum thalictroides]
MGSSFDWNSGIVFDNNITGFFNGFAQNSPFSPLGIHSESLPLPLPPSSSSSLVLDSEKGELVRAPAKVDKKGKSEAKTIAALKTHSEAERRRRERINSHLSTLRSLVPFTDKMDKASLLAEVINNVKELKRTTTEACKGYAIPMDVNEVKVEPHKDGVQGLLCIKVSVCCEDRPEIFADLRQVLETFDLKTVKAEMSTLGGRMKNVFIMSRCIIENIDNAEVHQQITRSVHQALTSILDKYSGPENLSPRLSHSDKRRRISLFDSSSSSS